MIAHAALFLVALAQEAAKIVREVGIDQRLGERVSLDTGFVDESGRAVKLGDYFGERSVILVFAYNRCPMLCTQVLNGLVRSLRPIDLDPGEDFEIVTVSIDPEEKSELAVRKKKAYVEEYGRAGAESAWHFLVGKEESIRRLAGQVGFRYVYDPATNEFAHASGFVVLTPSGVLSRYFYGLENPAGDVRLALVESSEGRVGSLADQVLLLCYHRGLTHPQAADVLDTQRSEHLRMMRILTDRKRHGDLADQLICDHALFHLEADLRWLELTAARLDELAGKVRA